MLKNANLKCIAALATLATLAFRPTAFGDITYTLHLGSSSEDLQVSNSVVTAAAIYNQYGSFNKHWDVYYNPGIPTAEANYNGYMGFGSQRTVRVALHEGGHTLGMGTGPNYGALLVNGVWTGQYGKQAQLDTYNSPDGLRGDGHAIWPGGFNYENEDGFIERIWHVRIMAAIRCDMGILAFSKEARNELVHPGQTAELRVESPLAATYQWYRNGVALMNGGDISGATSPVLRIANAELDDEGSYRCAITGAGETLFSRPRQLWVVPAQQLGQWDMEGNVTDSANTNHGTAFGSPAFVPGKIGMAIDLDGVDDYVALPPGVGMAKDITVATWVNWDGGGNWQRIFDFGTGVHQNMFLTPRSGDGTLRLAFKDAINGISREQQVNTTLLPTGQWVHLTAVLKDNYATLYVNGVAAGSVFNVFDNPIDFLPTQNYIGKSQYADPLFNGRIDDFRVYNYALTGAEVWDLWGQSNNQAPVFTVGTITLPDATRGQAYADSTLSTYASDADQDALTFSKVGGPAWISVSANGTISGTPGLTDEGLNVFVVRVTDPSGASSDATVQITVVSPPADLDAGPVAHWDFNDPDLGAAHGAALPDSDAYTVWRTAAIDKSGYGNHLTTWEYDWAGFQWSTNSPRGDFSIFAAGSYPVAYTWSARSLPQVNLESLVLSNFTVEALFTATGSGFKTVLGRDGRNVSTTAPDNAILYFGLEPSNRPVIEFTDMNSQTIRLLAPNPILANNTTWYHLAGVFNGTNLSLYLNGALIASTNRAMGPMANNSIGMPGGPGWHAGGWSVARGLWAGDHVDRWFGHIDEIAISGKALAPTEFVISTFDVWARAYNLAAATFDGDADGDGVANGVEYFLGSDPTDPLSPGRVLTLSDDLLSVTYPFNRRASGVTATVEWTTDLAAGDWTDAGVTYTTNASLNEIRATFASSVTNQLFIRLKLTR
ncbi:MAG TPA: hypothetical protein GYA07_05820 [Verrucomicrobia bacterium]|nr:hypothetical protein [Verrucomicrobiota bacterium]HOP96259.1 putative Ig domain-containing protein [Verrucomicrobiota bacterium]